MIVDSHLHLRDADERSARTAGAIDPFVETAASRGVDEIGFTEHVYYFRQTRALCLGSVHRVDGPALDSEGEDSVWKAVPVEGVWRRYFHAPAKLAGHASVTVFEGRSARQEPLG